MTVEVARHRCGESYLTAETIHGIERIKLHRKRIAQVSPVAVTKFGKAVA